MKLSAVLFDKIFVIRYTSKILGKYHFKWKQIQITYCLTVKHKGLSDWRLFGTEGTNVV